MNEVLIQYGFDPTTCSIEKIGCGLINHTWLLQAGDKKFILQKINEQVFKDPQAIASNITMIAGYLDQKAPGYLFTKPLQTTDEASMIRTDEGYFRIFPFIKNSHTIDVVSTPHQAFEAAKQFGKFTRLLSGFDCSQLHITLPDFHNLSLRYAQFETALKNGNPERIQESASLTASAMSYKNIVDEFERIKLSPAFKLRVTHHDTKISNVLFDEDDQGLCVIDLDTLMPGYFISDVGDMMRTYLCPVSEEEKDLSLIRIRKDMYESIRNGYLSEMGDELSADEKEHFMYAGKFMIYMQALRFLTDHLKNDVYYGARYEGHNFVRACNQFALLGELGALLS